MSDYENNGCFCLDELTECSENLKRLITALNEQYPVCLEKRDYDSISELHITAKALWAEFANILPSEQALSISAAPLSRPLMSMPSTAAGSRPTGQSSEKRPPTPSGM